MKSTAPQNNFPALLTKLESLSKTDFYFYDIFDDYIDQFKLLLGEIESVLNQDGSITDCCSMLNHLSNISDRENGRLDSACKDHLANISGLIVKHIVEKINKNNVYYFSYNHVVSAHFLPAPSMMMNYSRLPQYVFSLKSPEEADGIFHGKDDVIPGLDRLNQGDIFFQHVEKKTYTPNRRVKQTTYSYQWLEVVSCSERTQLFLTNNQSDIQQKLYNKKEFAVVNLPFKYEFKAPEGDIKAGEIIKPNLVAVVDYDQDKISSLKNIFSGEGKLAKSTATGVKKIRERIAKCPNASLSHLCKIIQEEMTERVSPTQGNFLVRAVNSGLLLFSGSDRNEDLNWLYRQVAGNRFDLNTAESVDRFISAFNIYLNDQGNNEGARCFDSTAKSTETKEDQTETLQF